MRTTKKLYQWDTDQKLIDCVGKYVDFPIGDEVYRIEVIDKECIIPDELLQVSGTVKVYECMEYGTVKAFAFYINPRPMPPDYVFTPTQRLTFEGLVKKVDETIEDLQKRADSGEFNGSDYVITESDYDAIAAKTAGKLQPTIGELARTLETEKTDRERADISLQKDISGKLSEPAEGLAVGKYFRVSQIDENGHAVLEAVDAKTIGVQDVKVNGESIVAGENGVADLPLATNTKLGIVTSAGSNYGIGISGGLASLNLADQNEIDARTTRKVISPQNIDYAIKAAMCDGKGEAWTENEQAAAQERLGVTDEFNSINTSVGELNGDLADLENGVSRNLYVEDISNFQIFDKDTMIPSEPIQIGIKSTLEYVSNTGYRLYVVEVNAKAGEVFTFNICDIESYSSVNIKSCAVYASNELPSVGKYALQSGSTSIANMRGSITLENDSKYLVFQVISTLLTYPPEPFTDACNALMEHIVVRKNDTYSDIFVPYGTCEIKYVMELSEDNLDSAVQEKLNRVSNSNIVKRVKEKVFNVSENLAANPILGSGWSGSLSDGFTHTSGSTDELMFDVSTDTNGVYIVTFDCATATSWKESDILVSIGNSPKVDCYNGTTAMIVGFIADGGKLKFTPATTINCTISNIKLFKVLDEGTELTQEIENFDAGQMEFCVTGFWNIAIGDDNLRKNENGSRNISLGHGSMIRFISGTRNICIGTFSMPFVTEGDRNIAIGADSLYGVTSLSSSKAYDNIAIGKRAMQNGSDIEKNVAIGSGSMASNTDTANANVAIGYRAGYYASSGNTHVGYNSGYFTKGKQNVSLGYNAGSDVYNTGDYNVCIGANSGTKSSESSASNTVAISDSIAIGHNAKATKSNQMILGSSDITEVVFCGNKKISFNSDGTVTWETV